MLLKAVNDLQKIRPANLYAFCVADTRAVQLIACDSHAHLVSKASSVIGCKSPSPVFKWSGS